MRFHMIRCTCLYVWMKSKDVGKTKHCLSVDMLSEKYKRNSTCSIFVFIERLGKKHHVSAYEHRTVVDRAREIRYLSDVMFLGAKKIILVMDNLNTHKVTFLYKAFLPAEVRRIIKQFESIYSKIWKLALW